MADVALPVDDSASPLLLKSTCSSSRSVDSSSSAPPEARTAVAIDSTPSPYRSFFLFTGLVAPPSWRSPWCLCYVGWRLATALCACFSFFSFLTDALKFSDSNASDNFYENSTFFIWLPLFVATITASTLYWFLPERIRELRMLESVPPSGAPPPCHAFSRSVLFLPVAFVTIFVMTGLANLLSGSLPSPPPPGHLVSPGSFPGATLILVILFLSTTSATTAVLGAFLLTLSVETRLLQSAVESLHEQARTRTLTRGEYLRVAALCERRSDAWCCALWSLAVIAVYFIVAAFFNTVSSYAQSVNDWMFGVNIFFKEAALLLCILFRTMGVNDPADALVAVLLDDVWAERGAPLECERLDLVFLATTRAIRPEALESACDFFTTPRRQPITFSTGPFRITRTFFLVTSLSLGGSIIGKVITSYSSR